MKREEEAEAWEIIRSSIIELAKGDEGGDGKHEIRKIEIGKLLQMVVKKEGETGDVMDVSDQVVDVKEVNVAAYGVITSDQVDTLHREPPGLMGEECKPVDVG